jgi:asparagine synthase (glutamine-hydrolysing)
MCGILGVVKTGTETKASLEAAFQSIRHRGPDHSGYFEDETIFIGNHRLTIQDVSSLANQPMLDATGKYVIVYNGEIYNHLSLRRELEIKGFTFQTHSDTETILNGFIAYGEHILERLNGIFAFAIYHTESHQIFIARDQLGVKPLYYYKCQNQFAFCSELKAFQYLPQFDDTINYSVFVNYLHYLWSPGEETPFKNVKRLLPGNFITWNLRNPETTLNIKQYYKVPFTGERFNYNENEWKHYVHATLEKAVQRQLLSDVPIGFFASGGIDSSLILALAAKQMQGKRMTCFTVNKNEIGAEGFSEDIVYAKEMCKTLDAELHIVDVDFDFWDAFDNMIYHLDEPLADIAPLYVYHISKVACENNIKVLLGGLGGDELFTGYRRHEALYYDKLLRKAPVLMHLPKVLSIRPDNYLNPLSRRLKKYVRNISAEQDKRLISYFEWFPVMKHKNIFSDAMLTNINEFHPEDYLYEQLAAIPAEPEELNKMLYLEMRSFLVDHNLNYNDKMGMAAGVEIRMPFLDLELVSLSTKIPGHYKMHGRQTKYILRKVAEKYLPQAIMKRSKTGFGGSVRNWVMGDWHTNILERIHQKQFEESGIFNKKEVLRLLEANRNNKIDGSYTLLSILSIDSWMQQFSKKRA